MRKVLLIEDDVIMRENTAEILELAQYEVIVAKDGKEGVALALKANPDIIICDIMMPGLDGHGVLHILSKDDKTSQVPFIFLTARAEKSDFRKGMNLGADDYLTKPFDDTELLNVIEMRLKKRELLKAEYPNNEDGLKDFFGDASRLTDLNDLFLNLASRDYKNKTSLFNEGDKPYSVYFLKSGKVKLVKSHGDGKDFIVDVYEDGDFIGAADFFLGEDFGYTAIFMEDSEIITMSKEQVFSLVLRNTDVASKFLQILSKSVKSSEVKLVSLAYDSVRKRVANAILHLSKSQNTLRITRDDLANYVGTATETLIRCLGEFKEDGYIQTKGRAIEIINIDRLNEIK